MYFKPLSTIIDSYSRIHYSDADEVQLQMSALPDIIFKLLTLMQSRICHIKVLATSKFNELCEKDIFHISHYKKN